MRKMLIGLSFFTILTTTLRAQVTVNLQGANIALPFPKEWLSTGSEKKNSFVFFNSKAPAPRPIVSLYASSFHYPNNLSEFEAEIRAQKDKWLKKVDATSTAPLEILPLPNYKTILVRYSFKSPQGEFSEWSHFEACQNKKAVVLKALIPSAHLKEFQNFWPTFESGLCQ